MYVLERVSRVPSVSDDVEEVGRDILRDDRYFDFNYTFSFLFNGTHGYRKLTSAGTLIAHNSTFGLEAKASHSNGESVYLVSTFTGAIPLGG